ncbi:hypothetical protein VT03_28040 [Planctomyces sp. SH-PL14]|nr:hypothetical protein VT03_28040 [Planctomyces sp. SH-PL14]
MGAASHRITFGGTRFATEPSLRGNVDGKLPDQLAGYIKV